MNTVWRFVATLVVWLRAWMAPLRGYSAANDEQGIVTRLEAYRELASSLSVVKSELSALPTERRSVQAALYLAAATVVKVLADTLSLFIVGGHSALTRRAGTPCRRTSDALEEERRAQAASELYRELFRLIEQARIEMARPGTPHPLVPDELMGEKLLAEPWDSLQQAAQNLEESYALELKLTGTEQGNLPELLARLRSKSAVATALAADPGWSRAPLAAEERLWEARLYKRIFCLWILISQELVCPGITTASAQTSDEPDPLDVFLMTDPVARARYERERRLEELERDIRYEVMRGLPWQPQDLEYLQEVGRLQSRGVLRRMASFWNVSPHPPVFRALRNGQLFVGGKLYRFRRGQDIVWACPMLRDKAALDGPVLIDSFEFSRVGLSCGVMSNAMVGSGRESGMIELSQSE